MAYGTQTTTLASTTAGVASTAVPLDREARRTTFIYTLSATGSTGSVAIQVTANDPSAPGFTAQRWAAASSTLISTAVDGAGGVVGTYLGPVVGARLVCLTAMTSGVTGTLDVTQSAN